MDASHEPATKAVGGKVWNPYSKSEQQLSASLQTPTSRNKKADVIEFLLMGAPAVLAIAMVVCASATVIQR